MQSATKFKFYVSKVNDDLFKSYYDLIFGDNLITLPKSPKTINSVYHLLNHISAKSLLQHDNIVLINGKVLFNANYDYNKLFDDFNNILKNTEKCIAEIKYFSGKHNDSVLIFNTEKCRELEVYETLRDDIKLFTKQQNNQHVLETIDSVILDLKEVYQDGELLLSPKNYPINITEGFGINDFLKIDPAFFEYNEAPKNYDNPTTVQLCNDLIYYLMNHYSYIKDRELSQKILKETFYINTLLYLKDREYEMFNRQ